MRRMLLAFALAALVPACGGSGDTFIINTGSMPASGNIVAVIPGNLLVSVSPTAPGTILTAVALSGIGAENVVGLDYRPANGFLYLVTDANKLYQVFPESGACILVGTGIISGFVPAVTGTAFGMDFNPTVDRIRLVSNTGTNIRVNPDTGAGVATDTNLSYNPGDPNAGTGPAVSAYAYTNNVSGAGTTVAYAIDTNLDILATFNGSPNGGLLVTVGSLGFNATNVSFDIAASGVAYLAADGQLYTVNLTTGAATLVGPMATGTGVLGLSVAP